MSELLRISGLSIRFGAEAAVSDLSFAMNKGETLALIGESGSGKSTLAMAIMRLLSSAGTETGDIVFDGRTMAALSKKEIRALRGTDMAMIFQEPMSSLNPVMTVGAQIIESVQRQERSTATIARNRAEELMRLVGIEKANFRFDDFPHTFSGGERQRVMIAMAVASRPQLLIADEPTTALDAATQAQIFELLDTLRRELSMSLLLITHDLGAVRRLSDRVVVMQNGLKIEEGRTAELLERPSHAYTRELLAAHAALDGDLHYRHARLATHAAEARGRGRVIRPPGSDGESTSAHVSIAGLGRPLLELENVHVTYRSRGTSVEAVDGVSFAIAHGETVGLLGESGCGKSSLGKAILRLVPTSQGQIIADDADITHLTGSRLATYRRHTQMIFQDPFSSLNPRHRVQDILDSALRVHGVNGRAERLVRIHDMADRVHLTRDSLKRYPHEFSGGQRQRVGIARALILRPSLVVCDEPVSALDMAIQAQILNLLVELKAELKLSYLFISHDLSVVRYMADRVLVMRNGKIVEAGNRQNIWKQPQHPFTQGLIKFAAAKQTWTGNSPGAGGELALAYGRPE
jgi:peptide/nickel transport system ATP-binding protein